MYAKVLTFSVSFVCHEEKTDKSLMLKLERRKKDNNLKCWMNLKILR